MRKIFCDICKREIPWVSADVYGLKLFMIDSLGHDSTTTPGTRLELCADCHRDAKASVAHWQKNGIVTRSA